MLRSAFTRCSGERTRREPDGKAPRTPMLRVRVPHRRQSDAISCESASAEQDTVRSRSSQRGDLEVRVSRSQKVRVEPAVHARRRPTEEPGADARASSNLGQYHLDVAQWKRAGPGRRRLGVRISPSRPILVSMRAGGTGTTPGSEPGGPGSNPGLAALVDVCAVVASFDSRVGLLREWGFLRSRVRFPSSFGT